MRYSSAFTLMLFEVLPLTRPCTAQARWSVDANPTLEIPGSTTKGDVAIERPVAATRLSNGIIVVGDGGASSVLFFEPSGRLVQRIGRAGDGPNEFRQIAWMGQCRSDSVFVWDLVLRRMTVIGAAGTVARQYAVPAPSDRGPAPFTVACSRAGVFAFQSLARNHTPVAGESVVRGEAPITLGDSEGHVTRTLGDFMAGEMILS